MRMAHNWIIRVHNWSHILIISSSCLQTEHAGVPLSSHDLSPPRAYYFSLKHTLPSSSPPSPQLSAQLLAPAMAPAQPWPFAHRVAHRSAEDTPDQPPRRSEFSAYAICPPTRRRSLHPCAERRNYDETTTKLRRNMVSSSCANFRNVPRKRTTLLFEFHLRQRLVQCLPDSLI